VQTLSVAKHEDRHDERRSNISVLDETTVTFFGRTRGAIT